MLGTRESWNKARTEKVRVEQNPRKPLHLCPEYKTMIAMILEAKQKSGKLLFSWLFRYWVTKQNGDVTLREAGSLELAQVGRDHQGGSCWVLPISVQAQPGTSCPAIGNVSLTRSECQPQESRPDNTGSIY